MVMGDHVVLVQLDVKRVKVQIIVVVIKSSQCPIDLDSRSRHVYCGRGQTLDGTSAALVKTFQRNAQVFN